MISVSLKSQITPSQIIDYLNDSYPELILVEFSSTETPFAFIGLEPFLTLHSHSFNDLRDLITKTKRPLEGQFGCRFTGMPLGYLTYEAELNFNCYQFGIYFDYTKKEIIISSIENTPASLKKIIQLKDKLSTFNSFPIKKFKQHKIISENLNPDLGNIEYQNLVQKAKRYIKQGDVFQIVLSRTFKKKFTKNPLTLYHALKITNPSPYHFYIKNKTQHIIGASPEKIVSVKNNIIETTPIAGSHPRVNQKEEEKVLKELLKNEKELAEHMMLVDLGRNDIGKVAKPGSVKVTRLKYITKLNYIYHVCSDIQGILAHKFDAIEGLKAVFPNGTLTGAPKIRAMELIKKLEKNLRNIYGGGIILFDHFGDLESAMMIRTALIKNKEISLRTGAGIVYDSNPEKEAQETIHKANGLLKAISLVENGEYS